MMQKRDRTSSESTDNEGLLWLQAVGYLTPYKQPSEVQDAYEFISWIKNNFQPVLKHSVILPCWSSLDIQF
jgi:hypothetical protein